MSCEENANLLETPHKTSMLLEKSLVEKKYNLQNYCINFCKILQENALLLTNFCNICLNLRKFLQKTYHSCKIFARVVFSLVESGSQCFCYCAKRIRYLRFYVSCFPLQNCRRNLTADSELSCSRRFRNRQK